MTICDDLTQVKNLKQNTTHYLLVHIHYFIIFANKFMIMMVLYEDINNVNDRSLLVLLEKIRDRNKKENRIYKRLSKIYVNNQVYNSTISSRLVKEGLMDCILPRPEITKFGAVYKYPPQYLTTEKGRKAIANGLFKSESMEMRNSRIRKLVTLISSIVAAIGALWAIVYPLFC